MVTCLHLLSLVAIALASTLVEAAREAPRVAREAPSVALAIANQGQPAAEVYPAERHATTVRFFCLEGEVKADPLKKALADLSTKEAGCGFVGEPMTSSTRPDKHVFAIEAPATVALADLNKALQKGSSRVTQLEWTLFRGLAAPPPSILGFSGRDCVIGMANDIRWFAFDPDGTTFYYLPGKLGAAKLADLYKKLFQPFEAGDVGKLARDTISWPLEPPVDEAAAKRAEKALLKLDGVREAHVDAAAHALRAVVELDGLKSSGPIAGGAGGAAGTAAGPRGARDKGSGAFVPRFDTNALLDALEKEKISLAREKH